MRSYGTRRFSTVRGPRLATSFSRRFRNDARLEVASFARASALGENRKRGVVSGAVRERGLRTSLDRRGDAIDRWNPRRGKYLLAGPDEEQRLSLGSRDG